MIVHSTITDPISWVFILLRDFFKILVSWNVKYRYMYVMINSVNSFIMTLCVISVLYCRFIKKTLKLWFYYSHTEDERKVVIHKYETVLDHNYPGGKWTKARKTHLVCKIDGSDVLIIITTNNWKKHAEEIVFNKI